MPKTCSLDSGPRPGNSKPGIAPDVQRYRKHAAGSGAERAESVNAFFFRGDVFEIALLLLEAHAAKPHLALELWSDSFAKVRESEGFDVEGVGARESRILVLVFAILFERDRPVFGDDELRAVLKSFEFAGDAPETGFDFFLGFENLAPDLEGDGCQWRCGRRRRRKVGPAECDARAPR